MWAPEWVYSMDWTSSSIKLELQFKRIKKKIKWTYPINFLEKSLDSIYELQTQEWIDQTANQVTMRNIDFGIWFQVKVETQTPANISCGACNHGTASRSLHWPDVDDDDVDPFHNFSEFTFRKSALWVQNLIPCPTIFQRLSFAVCKRHAKQGNFQI